MGIGGELDGIISANLCYKDCFGYMTAYCFSIVRLKRSANVRKHIVQYVSNAILMPRCLLVYIKGSSFSCFERFKD